jgi:hypothetical protein
VQPNEQPTSEVNIYVSIVAMLAVPILSGFIAIIMRQIRQMSEVTISSYSAYAVVIVLGIVNLF